MFTPMRSAAQTSVRLETMAPQTASFVGSSCATLQDGLKHIDLAEEDEEERRLMAEIEAAKFCSKRMQLKHW